MTVASVAFLNQLEGSVGTSVVVFDHSLCVSQFSPRATLLFDAIAIGAPLEKVFPFFAEHRSKIEETLISESAFPTDLPTGTPKTTVQLSVVDKQLTAWLLPVGTSQVESLATLSHEIRTPMNTVLGMAELLSTTQLSAAQSKYLGLLQNSGQSLLELVNNLLDMQKLSAGRMELRQEQFYLQELVDSTLDVLAVRAHAKGLELSATIRPDVPTYLVGDPDRLRQILTNLVGNAVKFTTSGSVFVCVERGQEDNLLRFVVDDTGPGVPNTRRSRLFLPFWQLHSAARSREGTGLGLSISKQLAEAMGGSLWHEDRREGGSRFVVTGRFVEQKSPERVTVRAAFQVASLRVLIVDDSSTAALSVANILAHWGPRVDVAYSRREASKKVRDAIERGAPFEMALIDGALEPSGGFTVAHELKGIAPELLPVMMLTSTNLEKDIRSAESMHLPYIVKPIKKEELLKTINKVLVAGRSSPALREPTQMVPKRILYVDDAPANRLFVETILENVGHHVSTFSNAEEALENLERGNFDFLFLDIQMPGMDGYELARRVRELEKQNGRRPYPLVALTAYTFGEHIDACYAAGFDKHLSKPVSRQSLLSMIQNFTRADDHALLHEAVNEARMAFVRKDYDALAIVGDRLHHDDASPHTQLGQRLRHAAEKRDRAKLKLLIDALDEIAKEPTDDGFGADTDSFSPHPSTSVDSNDAEVDSAIRQIVPAFLARRREDLVELDRALQSGDFKTISVLGHRMAGSGTTYGFTEISRLGFELERAAKAEEAEQTRELIIDLTEFMATLELE